MTTITTLLWDLGGVCLSDAWGYEQRQLLARQFALDFAAFEQRHRLLADALDCGVITFDAYLAWTLFQQRRPFSAADVLHSIYASMTPIESTLRIVAALRASGRYLLVTANNESRELHEYRVARFGLSTLFQVFFCSCYLGLKKPDWLYYQRILEMLQRPATACLLIDNQLRNVEAARLVGMAAVHVSAAMDLPRALEDAGIEL